MLNLMAIFGTSFALALSGALMPGPLLTVTISESVRRGAWTGPQIIAGHAVLEFFMVIILLMGVGPLLQSDRVFIIIAFAGAAVMLWMSLDMFRSLPVVTLLTTSEQKIVGHPVVAGFMMSLANPYWVIWWAAIGLGYVTYSMAFGIDDVLYLYEDRNSLEKKAFLFHVTNEMRTELSEKIQRIHLFGLSRFIEFS